MADYSTLSDEQIMQMLRPQQAAPANDLSSMSDADLMARIQAAQPSTTADVAKSGGIGLAEGVIGLAGLPGDVAELGARGIDWATRKIGGALGVDVKPREARDPTYGSADIKKGVESLTGKFYKPQTTAGEYARTVGQFAPAALAGPGGLTRKVVTQAVAPGLASEAAGQVTKGMAAEPYARIGAALAAPSAASRLITPNPIDPARRAMIQTLENEGVTSLTAGQRSGNTATRYAESILGDSPGAGQGATRMQQEGIRQFVQAAARRADETGAMVDASPAALAANRARHDQIFANVTARNPIAIDRQFGTELVDVAQKYVAKVGVRGWHPGVQQQMRNIIETAQVNGGVLPGATYQSIRATARRNAKALDNTNPDAADAYRGIMKTLDDAMERSVSPQDRALWMRTRREYGNQKDIEKAATRAGNTELPEGQFRPSDLRSSVTGYNRSGHARGQGDFHNLVEAGARVMNPLPNSGTGQRNLITGLAAGGGLASAGLPGLAAIVGPAAIGRLMMSRPGQAYLGNQAAGQTSVHNRALAALLRAQGASVPAIQGR